MVFFFAKSQKFNNYSPAQKTGFAPLGATREKGVFKRILPPKTQYPSRGAKSPGDSGLTCLFSMA
jgi:hypothetical protein